MNYNCERKEGVILNVAPLAACLWPKFALSLWMQSPTTPAMSCCGLSQSKGKQRREKVRLLVMLKAHKEEGHKRQRRLCRNEGLVTATDQTLIFSHAFVLISFAFPSLTHSIACVIVQWLGSASG